MNRRQGYITGKLSQRGAVSAGQQAHSPLRSRPSAKPSKAGPALLKQKEKKG